MRLKKVGLPVALAVLTTLVLVSAVWSFSKWFSPVTGYSDQNPDWWQAQWMWSDSVNQYVDCHAWEFELRGRDGHNINEYYCGAGDWWTNLPIGYMEHDEDDYTFGSHRPDLIEPWIWYSGWMVMYPCYNPGIPAFVESELGYDWCSAVDPYPLDWEQISTFVPGYVSW